MATESELNEDQHRLLRAFNDLAEGGPTTDVAASDAARAAGVQLLRHTVWHTCCPARAMCPTPTAGASGGKNG